MPQQLNWFTICLVELQTSCILLAICQVFLIKKAQCLGVIVFPLPLLQVKDEKNIQEVFDLNDYEKCEELRKSKSRSKKNHSKFCLTHSKEPGNTVCLHFRGVYGACGTNGPAFVCCCACKTCQVQSLADPTGELLPANVNKARLAVSSSVGLPAGGAQSRSRWQGPSASALSGEGPGDC